MDQVKVYEVKIQALVAQNKLLEAVDTGLDILNKLGITFPKKPNKLHVLLGLIRTKSALLGKSIADLVNLPQMMDLEQISAMRILLAVTPALYFGSPNLYALTVFKKVTLSIKYGNTHESALAYLDYGIILCNILGNIETGCQFGEIAIQLFERDDLKHLKARIFLSFYAFIKPWKHHLNTTLQPLLEGYYSGLETGELDYAGYAAQAYSFHLYYAGTNLIQTRAEISKYCLLIEKIKQKNILMFQKITQQTVMNLIGESHNTGCLIGTAYNEELMLPIHEQANDRASIFNVYNYKMFIFYLFGNYDQARESMVRAEPYLDSVMGLVHVLIFFFYSSLINLAIVSNAQVAEKRNILNKVKANQKKMKKWAESAPMNHLHKWYLVEAELARVLGKNSEAMEHYDRAITLACTNEYTQDQAIANELAAKFYLEWGKQNIAQVYLTQAYYCYARWGASAKVDDLEKRYSELLAPILQQEKISLNAHNSLSCNTYHTIRDSAPSIALDLAAAVKASSLLSGEIQLEQLLSTLMQVVMQNAGASMCALILHQDNNLKVVVTAQVDANNTVLTTVCSTPLESSLDVPVTLINYVYRTLESLVIDDTSVQSLPINSDRYILRSSPKSLLCIPVINQGKLQGILYLENNLTTGAFTGDRVRAVGQKIR